MNKIISVITFVITLGISNTIYSQNFSSEKIKLKTINYDLKLDVDFEHGKLFSVCELTVFNPTKDKIHKIPLLLYRLMKVSSVSDENGNSIAFSQQVLSFEDWDLMQVNYIEVEFKDAILANQSRKIKIKYSGYLMGYSETGMSYVKDRIDPKFTIIRPDCYAYPEVGYPSLRVNKETEIQSFNYTVSISIPDSLMAINGGELIEKSIKNNIANYTYRNIKKAWRIDISVGKYDVLTYNNTKLYFFEEDSIGANTVFRYMKKTFGLYSKWWGELQNFQGFSLIEIADGYGSQADVSSILQTASVFKDSTEMRQMYHEISHLWNVPSVNEIYPRWNEGLATFIEYLTIEKLEKREYLDYVSKWYYNEIQKNLQTDSVFMNTPIINYGDKNIQSYSYSVGMIMFQVLYGVIGEEEFNKIIGSFYEKYYQSGASTIEFIEHATQKSTIDLTVFFNDWIYTTNYKIYFMTNTPINEIINAYK